MLRNGTQHLTRKVIALLKPLFKPSSSSVENHVQKHGSATADYHFQVKQLNNNHGPLSMFALVCCTLLLSTKQTKGDDYVGSHDLLGKRDGHGTLKIITGPTRGTIYIGEFKHGKKHGHGVMELPNGHKLEGNPLFISLH
jgi:hypothetical protein